MASLTRKPIAKYVGWDRWCITSGRSDGSVTCQGLAEVVAIAEEMLRGMHG